MKKQNYMMTMNNDNTDYTINNNKLSYNEALLEYFKKLKLDRRLSTMQEVLDNRTRYITVVLENIYQPHNASAVLRSCDCFGIQDVHIIENSYKYEINKEVEVGSSRWLNIITHNESNENTASCIEKLKKTGYRIIATTPHGTTTNIQSLDIHKGKFALMFGTELDGLTEEALSLADERVYIPMYGFTESFNISVSVSLSLFHFSEQIRNSDINWKLSNLDKNEILLQWLRNTTRESNKIEKRFKAMYEKGCIDL